MSHNRNLLISSVKSVFDASVEAFQASRTEDNFRLVTEFGEMMAEAFLSGRKVLACGNGGSHCDALHLSEEFTGRFKGNRRALPALALGEATHQTCVGNDLGFDEVFSRGVEAFGNEGDVCVLISTSGNSPNIIKAYEMCREKGIKTVALLGKTGGKLRGKCDVEIIVPADESDRVQEVHMTILHAAIEVCERILFPDHYKK